MMLTLDQYLAFQIVAASQQSCLCRRASVGFEEHVYLFVNDQLRNQRRVVG